jgi:hypothetical protein
MLIRMWVARIPDLSLGSLIARMIYDNPIRNKKGMK